MNKPLAHVGGIFCAVGAAVILYVLTQDVFYISSEAVAVGSLASAGILSMACVASALKARR